MAMAVGKPLLGPLDKGLATTEAKNRDIVILTESIYVSLKEWLHMIKLIGAKPVECKRLVLHPAAYQGFVDASHWGVGGVWFGRSRPLPPIVWFLEWPSHLIENFLTDNNPSGSINISELELAGVLLHWLVLEAAISQEDLRFASVAIWCDNLPAVAWLYKMRSSSSLVSANLVRALAVRIHMNESAKLAGEHLSGKFNVMADTTLRRHPTNTEDFLSFFSSKFPPPKEHCWTLCRLKHGTYSRVISELSGKRLPLASWKRLPKKGGDFWQLGSSTFPIQLKKMTRSSITELISKKSTCWLPLPTMCDTEAFLDENNVFVPKQSKWLSAPSPRSSNWMDNQTRWLRCKENMFKRSNSYLPATDG